MHNSTGAICKIIRLYSVCLFLNINTFVDMNLKSLSLINYQNFESLDLDFSEKVKLFCWTKWS